MAYTHFTGPVVSQNGFISGTGSVVSVTTSAVTITASAHAGRVVLLNRAAGVTATLPAATGTGNTYQFIVKTTVTSNSDIIKVANSTDVMQGRAYVISDNTAAVLGYAPAASDDTITLNGTTTGGYVGDIVTVQDIASGFWQVVADTRATGTEATPFSATV